MSLLARFGLASFVLVVALGVVLGVQLQRAVEARALRAAEQNGHVAASIGMSPALVASDLKMGTQPLAHDRLVVIEHQLRAAVSSGDIVRLKVWNRQHVIVYSDDVTLIGRQFPGRDLDEVFATGKMSSEAGNPTSAENVREQGFGRLLAVYLPLRASADGALSLSGDGEVLGAFEIYQPYEPVAAAIRADTRRLFVWLAAGLLLLFLGLFRIVASGSRRIRRQAADHLHQARHDALTGLANRVEFRRLLTREVVKARAERSGFAVVLIDLDRFKEVNDTLGHQSGDLLLVELARRLRENLRGTDVAARLGGDEFALLLPGIADRQQLDLVLALVERLMAEPAMVGGFELDLNGSVGVVLYPEHGDDADTLLQRAEVAMYEAKRTLVHSTLYRPEIDRYSPARLRLAGEIRRAIDEGELYLAYQPKLSVLEGRIYGVEALLRWRHPDRGIIPPLEFLPVLENTELIHLVTRYVIEEAVAQCARWQSEGLVLNVAVNLSARNLADPDLPAQIADALRRHGVAPAALEVELTETAVLADPERARRALCEIHDLGVRVAIDDFGTGYASLAYVSSLPIDTLKIDGSFVKALATDPRAEAIVNFTIGLGRSLGLSVVAEGVEDGVAYSRLASLGCEYMQGYRIAKPMVPIELGHFLNSIGRPVAEQRAS